MGRRCASGSGEVAVATTLRRGWDIDHTLEVPRVWCTLERTPVRHKDPAPNGPRCAGPGAPRDCRLLAHPPALASCSCSPSVLVACTGWREHRTAPERPTRTTAPVHHHLHLLAGDRRSCPGRFTITGSRAGFAHGFELVRRESPADVEADLDLMASTGAQWLRASITWGSIELSPGVYNWAGTDRVVQGALARGLSVVAVVSSAPGWDRKPGCETDECAPNDPAPVRRVRARRGAAVRTARRARLGDLERAEPRRVLGTAHPTRSPTPISSSARRARSTRSIPVRR